MTTGKLRNKQTGEMLTVEKVDREGSFLVAGTTSCNWFNPDEWDFYESPTPGVFQIDKREHLIAHIEGLQNVLTKRNATIEQQAEDIKRLEDGEPTSEGLKEAYRKGYLAARAEIRDDAQEALNALQKVRYPAPLVDPADF